MTQDETAVLDELQRVLAGGGNRTWDPLLGSTATTEPTTKVKMSSIVIIAMSW